MEYVLLVALVAVITVSSATFLNDLRCQQLPQAFCRATKAITLDKTGQDLQTEMDKCQNLNVCNAQ